MGSNKVKNLIEQDKELFNKDGTNGNESEGKWMKNALLLWPDLKNDPKLVSMWRQFLLTWE